MYTSVGYRYDQHNAL